MVTRQNSQAGGRPGWVGGAAERGTGKKEKKMWQRVVSLSALEWDASVCDQTKSSSLTGLFGQSFWGIGYSVAILQSAVSGKDNGESVKCQSRCCAGNLWTHHVL